MDPPALMSDGGAYSLSEIWPFAIGSSAGRPPFGQGQFGDFASGSNRGEMSGSDPMSVDGRARKRRDGDNDENDCAKGVSSSSNNDASDCNGKRVKPSGCKDDNGEAEAGSGKAGEQSSRAADPAKQDYIHVRARRGQATDSHSLAERARREKISERMKILQDLVPGCNKVIGKALVLDEIINYIQSLQRQVEFLSMKLEAVNSRMTPGIEVFPSKDMNLATQFGQQAFEAAGMAFSQPPRDFSRGSSPDWLHMQVGGGFERAT